MIWANSYADINLSGLVEAQFGTKYTSDSFHWNMWDPDFKTELRFWTSPFHNTDAYVKFYADKWNEDGQMMDHSEAILAEGHVSFREEKNGIGFTSVFFTRENNHYWTDGSMLNLLNTGSVNNDGNGQGVRLDFWEKWNGSATYIFSDFSQGESDDIHLLRLRQSFLGEKIKSGVFFQRKNYGFGGENQYNQVIATDQKLQLGRYFLNIEFAVSDVPAESETNAEKDEFIEKSQDYFDEGKYLKSIGEFFKSNLATKCEFRGLRLGSPELGYWFFNPGIWSFGKCYRNYMGDNKQNETGLWINSYYMLPQKAITLTMNYSIYKKMEAELYPAGRSRDPVTNLYNEIYIEFVNGFSGKMYYNKKDEVWHGKNYKHNDFFVELSVENKLAKLLTQFKIKDIGVEEENKSVGLRLP